MSHVGEGDLSSEVALVSSSDGYWLVVLAVDKGAELW